MSLSVKNTNKSCTDYKSNKIAFAAKKMINQQKTAEAESMQLSSIPSASIKAKYLSFSGSSEFLTEKDLPVKFQEEWAKKVPINQAGETIDPIRLSPIKLGNHEEMLKMGVCAGFDPYSSTILINPTKEITETCGGIEGIAAHESTHSYLHNLRKALGHQEPNTALAAVVNTVLGQMLSGESGYILAPVKAIDVNGQKIGQYDVMIAPQLAPKERESVVGFINQLTQEDITNDKVGNRVLSKQGRKKLFETVIPEMNDYRKYLELRGLKPNRTAIRAFSVINMYVNAACTRIDLMKNTIWGENSPNNAANIAKPLTPTEKEWAVLSMQGHLPTLEGNFIQQMIPGSDITNKAYLLSFEERLARKFEISVALEKINEKIEKTNNAGINKELLLNKKSRLEKDMNLLSLLDNYVELEQEMVSAPKDVNKMAKAFHKRQKSMSETRKLVHTFELQGINLDILSTAKTAADQKRIAAELKQKLPESMHAQFDALIFSPKHMKKLNQGDKAFSPLKSLANTPENLELAKKYRTLLKELREFSKESTLIGLPRFLFRTDKDYKTYAQKTGEVFVKWAKKLAHK